jgi:hypothetical protein
MPRDMAGMHGFIVSDRRGWMGGSVSPWESRDREFASQKCRLFPETAKRWATLFLSKRVPGHNFTGADHSIPSRHAIKNPNVLARLRSVHGGQRKESSNWNELSYTRRPAKLIGTNQSDGEHHSPKNQNQFKWLLIFVSEISRRSLHLEQIVLLIGRTRLA